LVYCPECDTNLDLEEDEMDEGDVVSCPECGTEYEIITISPIELKPVEDEAYEEEDEEEAEDGDFS
jgi:alpha-aminoadipate/glutamate carrier protein LysW